MNSPHYSAHAFHDQLPKGRASGELRVTRSGVEFQRGEHKITLPFAGLRIKLGGASDRLIFFEHPRHPDWSLYTADLAILKDPLLHERPELSALLRGMRNKRRRNWSLLIGAAAVVLALPVILLLNMDRLAAIAARQVPVEWEQQLGRSAFAQYQLQSELLDDQAIEQPLQTLTGSLTQALPDTRYSFEFHVVRDEALNAFALPGGVIVIHSGLIERADSADELLGVLAHEISHVTEQHGLRNVITSAGVILTVQALIGDASGLLATIAGATPLLLNQSYSRDFERDADQRGVALLEKANLDPLGLERFFHKILEQEQKLKEQIDDADTAAVLESVSGFLSTHPATEERIERIRQLAGDSQGPYRDLQPAFQALQTAIAQFDTPSEDESDADSH